MDGNWGHVISLAGRHVWRTAVFYASDWLGLTKKTQAFGSLKDWKKSLALERVLRNAVSRAHI
jgi:hypothetical protein